MPKSLRSLASILVPAVLVLMPTAAGAADMSSEITVSAQDFDEYLPDVAYNSVHDEYFVVWHDDSPLQGRSVMGRRYTAAGAFIAEYVIAFNDTPPRDNAQPAVAYDKANDRYLVVWVYDYFGDGSDWDVHGRLVPWNGPSAGLTSFTINTFSSKQWNPRVAFGGTVQEFMVTWWNEGSGGVHSYVSAQRVDTSGSLQGGTITVTSSATEERVAPDIAYNQARNEYIIVYQKMEAGGGDVYGVRLTGTGNILGGGDFGIAGWPDAETAPRIAASRVSNLWVVVWQSQIGVNNKDVYSRSVWVDGTGTVQMGTPVHFPYTPIDESSPDVAVHPESSNFLITWEQQYSNSTGPYGIFAEVWNADQGLGRLFRPTTPTVSDLKDRISPAVAAGVNDWFVAWEHNRNATPSYQDIHGRVLFADVFADGFESHNTSNWSMTVQ